MVRAKRFFLLAAFAVLWSALPAIAQKAPNARPRAAAHTPSLETLDAMVKDLRYEDLEASLPSLPTGPERDYFAGILANREGRVDESIQLLQPVIPQIQEEHPAQAAIGLWTLADDCIKSYRYLQAIGFYENVLAHFRTHLDSNDLKSIEDDYNTAKLLQNAPAQTISFAGPVRIPTHRGALDSLDANLTVNGVTASWILDTGANFSTVSASFAKRLGVKLSAGVAQTQGITGAENPLHVAILPELKLGSATVRNVVLLVLDDSNLNVPLGHGKHFQIDAVLGYPVFQALGAITFTSDGWFEAGSAAEPTNSGARLFMHELTPLLECSEANRKLLFSFDTGANESVFSVRYYRDFPAAFRALKKKRYGMSGAGGAKMMYSYHLPRVALKVGATQALLHDVPVIPAPTDTDLDKVYGNLGRDLVAGSRSFTLDFTNMRFALGSPVKSPGQ